MSTDVVTYKSVSDAIIRRCGMDPLSDSAQDTARSICEHVNERMETIWPLSWPQFSRTEQRAFRQLWYDDHAYYKSDADGYPDEFYWLDNETYYQVNPDAPTDPPMGTLPSDANYFIVLENVTPFISATQANQRQIGNVLGVYPSDPSFHLNGCNDISGQLYVDPVWKNPCNCRALSFRPTSKGILVTGSRPATVFVWYRPPIPQFTAVPFIPGKDYVAGERVYYPATGHCYRALAPNVNHLPTETVYWTVEILPKIFAKYIKAGAFADSMRDWKANAGPDIQMRMGLASMADQEAEAAFEREMDKLSAAGRKSPQTWGRYGARQGEPWNGDRVQYLSNKIILEGYLPPPVPVIGTVWEYHPEIVSETGDEPALASISTVDKAPGSRIDIAIVPPGGVSRQQRSYFIHAGVADPDDPGQIAPRDYDPITNQKYLARI